MSSISPAPNTPQTADKAKTGAMLSGAAVAVLMALAFYFDDRNGTNLTEMLMAVLAGLGVGGGVGKAVHATPNKALARRDRH